MYNVNWTTREIFIPASDMENVSGSEYRLNMSDFHKEIRRLEWEFTEGLPYPQILDHTIAKTISGATYVPFDEIINNYTITFDPIATKVILQGSNNNIVDVMNINGVTVIPTNSAGNTITSVGSGLSSEQDLLLKRIDRIIRADEERNVVDRKYYKRDEDTGEVLIEKDYNKDPSGNETLTKS